MLKDTGCFPTGLCFSLPAIKWSTAKIKSVSTIMPKIIVIQEDFFFVAVGGVTTLSSSFVVGVVVDADFTPISLKVVSAFLLKILWNSIETSSFPSASTSTFFVSAPEITTSNSLFIV